MQRVICITIFIVLFVVGCGYVLAIPAFPGAEGFGANSIGGRGGTVYEVTNLNDSGPGSLRAAVETSGPRIVVFRVSGTIELLSELEISDPYITIAGQTAPGDGICLKGHQFQVQADHVIVSYLRFRPGSSAPGDAVWIKEGHNIIFDHCSASWATDEVFSVAQEEDTLGNVTVQWCMITEGLNASGHGYGSLVRGGWGNGITFHHNLYAHHKGRCPRPGNYNNYVTDPCGLLFDFRNNIIYNWAGPYAGYNADTDSITKMNFVGNYYKQGNNSTDDYAFQESCTYSRAFFSANWMNDHYPSNPWILVRYDGFDIGEIFEYQQSEPFDFALVQTDDAETAYSRVLAEAGASFPLRDAVDERIVNDVINGTGYIINSEADIGGWPVLESDTPPTDSDHDGMPDYWESRLCLDPYDASDSSEDRDGDGYTNIEEYINWLPTGEPIPVNVDLDCDNTVNFRDFAEFVAHYASVPDYNDRYDFDADGEITIQDLSYVVQDWLSQ